LDVRLCERRNATSGANTITERPDEEMTWGLGMNESTLGVKRLAKTMRRLDGKES